MSTATTLLQVLIGAATVCAFPVVAAHLVGAIQRGPARKTMTPKTYELKTLHDLLQVPPERRADMLSEVEQAMLMYELMAASDQAAVAAFSMTWTDDGCRDTVVTDQAGAPVLTLHVKQPENTTGQPAAQEAGTPGEPLSTDKHSQYLSVTETASLMSKDGAICPVHIETHDADGESFSLRVSTSGPDHGKRYYAQFEPVELMGDVPQHEYLTFQTGNPLDVGVNGWTNEALLAVLIDRTQRVDALFPCVENKRAVDAMKEAKQWFDVRAHNRRTRGVAGKQEV